MFRPHAPLHHFTPAPRHAAASRGGARGTSFVLACCLLAAWPPLAPAGAAAQSPQPPQDAQPSPAQVIGQMMYDGVKRRAAKDLDGAIALLRKAVELSEKNFGPDDSFTGWAVENLGEVYVDKGEYREAERHLLRAMRILEKTLEEMAKGPEPSDPSLVKDTNVLYASAAHSLATAYDYMGDLSRAEPLYERALAVREKVLGPEHAMVTVSLNFLGNLYLNRGDYALAEQMFQRAMPISQKLYGPEHRKVTELLNNLAYTYDGQGDAAKAEELYKRAIAIAEKWEKPETLDLATYLNNLGELYRTRDPAKSRTLLDRALALREKLLGPDDPQTATTHNNLGMLDWQVGDLEGAERRLTRSLEIMRRAHSYDPGHPDVLSAIANLAWLYVAKGEVKRAVGMLSDGSKYSERNLLLKLTGGSEKQKRLYMQSTAEGTSGAISLHLHAAPDDELAARFALNTILWRKGRVLDVMSGQAAAIMSGSDAEGRAALAKLADARARLSALELKGPEGDEARYKAAADALESQIQSLEKVVSERAMASGVTAGAVSVESVQAAIPAGGALVEVIQYRPAPFGTAATPDWGQPRYAAYVLKQTGPPTSVVLGEAAKIDEGVARLREALRNWRRGDVRALARAVDDQVMRPVRELLGDARHVLISPDGALNLLPFAALVDERNRFLVESYTFTYLTSGRDLLRMKERLPSKQGAVVIANPLFGSPAAGSTPPAGGRGAGTRAPAFDERFAPLGGTAEEAQEVSSILRAASVFTGAQATEAAVKQVRAPSILHIATHGFFRDTAEQEALPGSARHAPAPLRGRRPSADENPLLRSGIALAGANRLEGGKGEDGVLTALEAAGLDLRGTELIALSACETGVGEVQTGEGVYGLRRALVLAGSESQLMSLWKVDDYATRELMAGFYRRLKAGEGRSEALRQVQLRLLGAEEYAHPFFWAGFILSGKWGAL